MATGPGTRRQRSADTEQALKDAARRLFAERGYLNTKIVDITTAAGRSAGSFYNHFAGKEELLQALLQDIAAAGDSAAEGAGHTPDFTDPAAVEYHIEQYWTYSRQHWPVLRAVTQAALVDEDFARLAARFGAEQLTEVVDHVDGFEAAGLRLPAAPDLSVAMMFLLVRALLEAVREGVVQVGDEQAIAALTRFVYRGLTGRDY